MRRWRRCPTGLQGGALGFRRVVVQVVVWWWRGQRMKRLEATVCCHGLWGRRKCSAAVCKEGHGGGSTIEGYSGSM